MKRNRWSLRGRLGVEGSWAMAFMKMHLEGLGLTLELTIGLIEQDTCIATDLQVFRPCVKDGVQWKTAPRLSCRMLSDFCYCCTLPCRYYDVETRRPQLFKQRRNGQDIPFEMMMERYLKAVTPLLRY